LTAWARKPSSFSSYIQLIAHQFPLFAIDIPSNVGQLVSRSSRKQRPDALRLRIRKVLEQERVDNRKDGGVGADGKRQRDRHSPGKGGVASELTDGRLEEAHNCT
jgi:hypothetical protein